MTIHVALPAYNESLALPGLLGRFNALAETVRTHIRIYVIDDGSTDQTAQVARDSAGGMTLQVVSHPHNLGLGQAVQTAIRTVVADADDHDVLIIMDADDTHNPSMISDMVQEIEQGADVVISSRFVAGGDDTTAPPFRRLLSRGAAVCFRTALPVDRTVQDFTSGYRAYRVSVLRRALSHWGERLIEEKGFACMVELLLKLRYCKPQVAEVPMYLEYDRKLGASKIKILRTIMQYLRLAIRDRVSPPPYRDL